MSQKKQDTFNVAFSFFLIKFNKNIQRERCKYNKYVNITS